MRKYVIFISLLIWSTIGFAQVPGTWNEYFSFRNVQQLEGVDDNIFALSENGIFIYNTSSHEIQKITKINGLSTVGLTCMAFNDSTSSFLIGYSDGTLDILHYPSLKVHPIPTVANKSLYGSKKINAIAMKNDTAVIATEFGVLTFSMTTKKFFSTTILSNDGSYVPAKSVTIDRDTMYAATTKGIFSVNLSSTNISDFSSWAKLKNIPYENDTISYITALNGTIYYAHKNIADASKDSVFKIHDGKAEAFKVQHGDIKRLIIKKDVLSIVTTGNAFLYENDEKTIYTSKIKKNTYDAHFTDIIKISDSSIWISDYSTGLVNGEFFNTFCPKGPQTNFIADMQLTQGNLHIVEGVNSKYRFGLYDKKTVNNMWYGHTNWDIKNTTCIYTIPNSDIYYYGSCGWGLVKCSNTWSYDNIYNSSNSPIGNAYYGTNLDYISDISLDKNGNVWMINYGTKAPLLVFSNSNNWQSYLISTGSRQCFASQLYIDDRNYKWITGDKKLIVFYENNTLDDKTDDLLVEIDLTDNEGYIASNTTCLAEDLDGDIWIGTNQGIAVHTSPSRVFKDRQNISRIKIEIDGEVGYLLSSENITCIAVDGANRKWIGTENSGVFLISENGTEQLLNFTKNNSPLPANNITSIAIDHKTGEVFLGTQEGLVSYIGDATEGNTEMTNVKIYPNPVRETYDGDIYIQGLVADAIIKITDTSGNLVKTITANGGTATWDGRNLYGDRVKTGVYLLYISDESATYTTVEKILFIN